jgi:hypothetical protein
MNWLAAEVGEPRMEAQRHAMYERELSSASGLGRGISGQVAWGHCIIKDQMCPCLLLTSCPLTLKKASPDVIVSSFRSYVFLKKNTTSKVAI